MAPKSKATKPGDKNTTTEQTPLDRRQALKAGITAVASAGGLAEKARADQPGNDRPYSSEQLYKIGVGMKSYMTPIKKRAIDDYHSSFQKYGGQLSNPIGQLFENAVSEQPMTIVIVGSGYGASICATRLSARLGKDHRICILERGREWVPGTFPDTFRDASNNARQKLFGRGKGDIQNPLGLYNVKVNDGINTLSASGLGGTSLINASVALKPDADVFRQKWWPNALRDRAVLDPYFHRAASAMLLTRTPYDLTGKVCSRRKAGEKISPRPGFFDRTALSVMYDDRHQDAEGRNTYGVYQQHCSLCGDCITGCNVGAKNTLTTTYLPIAKAQGTELYTQVEVNAIEKLDGLYRLHLTYLEDCDGQVAKQPFTLTSQIVILGAGSPGSAEILLQSKNTGLQLSPGLGQRWSFNGDTIGFVMDTRERAKIGGHGAYIDAGPPVGPTVQTSLFYDRRPSLRHRILIQEAAIPRGMTKLFSILLKDRSMDNSMVMLGMGHDGSKGKLVWKDNRWQVDWPGLRDSRYRKMIFREFGELAKAHGGWYKRLQAFGDTLVSVHPLGGCGMSDDPIVGVVNDRGQVYDGEYGCSQDSTGEPAVHSGLYVADGSVVPMSLGVNPLMTISALSERIADGILSHPSHAHLFKKEFVNG